MKTRRAASRIARSGITHSRRGSGFEVHSLETWQAQCPAVQCRLGVNAYAPFAVCSCLIKRNDGGIGLHDSEKKIFVAEAGEVIFLLRRIHALKIVDRSSLNSKDVPSNCFGKRRLFQEFRPLGYLC